MPSGIIKEKCQSHTAYFNTKGVFQTDINVYEKNLTLCSITQQERKRSTHSITSEDRW